MPTATPPTMGRCFFMPDAGDRVVMTGDQLSRTVTRMAHEILEKNAGDERLAIVGIHTRGAFLARRLHAILRDIAGREIPSGDLDIKAPQQVRHRRKCHPALDQQPDQRAQQASHGPEQRVGLKGEGGRWGHSVRSAWVFVSESTRAWEKRPQKS